MLCERVSGFSCAQAIPRLCRSLFLGTRNQRGNVNISKILGGATRIEHERWKVKSNTKLDEDLGLDNFLHVIPGISKRPSRSLLASFGNDTVRITFYENYIVEAFR